MAPPKTSRDSRPAAPASAAAVPALHRDAWAWAVPLALGPTLWASRGTPLASAVADDFEYLHYTLLRGNPTWLDGGGVLVYWRPLARQLYYGLFAKLILSHPAFVAALHVLALALAGVLAYSVLRRALPRSAAAFAAMTPLLLDGTRQVIGWTSCAQELGAFVFLVLGLVAARRGSLPFLLAASLGALLCKETAAAALPLLAWTPRGAGPLRRRFAWSAALVALLGAWWLARSWVAVHAGLMTIADAAPPAGRGVSATLQLGWVLGRSILEVANVGLLAPPVRTAFLAAGAAVVGLAVLVAIGARARRAALRDALPWAAWGLAWFVLTTLPAIVLYPDWSSYRGLIPALGLGTAVGALVAAAGGLPAALLGALRLAALLMAPGAPQRVGVAPEDYGTFFDFPTLARNQRFVAETRGVLMRARPTLPKGARIVKHAWPRLIEYVFEEGRAFQVWYGDSTLRWMTFQEFQADPSQHVDAILEYQPGRPRPVSVLEPGAMRALLAAVDSLKAGRWQAGLARLDESVRLEPDTSNAVFLAQVESKRAMALRALGRSGEAEAAALRAFAHYADDQDARVLLAEFAAARGDRDGALRRLEEHLVRYPGDALARHLRDEWSAGASLPAGR